MLATLRLLGASLAACALLGSAAGCGKRGISAPTGGATLSPAKVILARNVELSVAQQRALVYRVETVGVLEAEGQTDIAAGVSGVVDQVFFREGDEVRAGTLLVTVDQARYQADEELARANVERAKAGMDLARDLNERAERAGRALSEEDRAKARGNLKISEAEHLSSVAALARARNHLAVTCPLNSYATRRSADYSIDQLSRFLDRGVRAKMERVVPRMGGGVEPEPEPAPAATIDLRALLRGRFGA